MSGIESDETEHVPGYRATWEEWFGELDDTSPGIWTIPDAESLATGPPDPDYSVLPSFLADWLLTIDFEEDASATDSGWRRCADAVAHEGILVVLPQRLLDEDRSVEDSSWATQPPTRVYVAYAFTDELAIVWRWKDWEKFPIGFVSRERLEEGFAQLVDAFEEDDEDAQEQNALVRCDSCDGLFAEWHDAAPVLPVFSDPKDDDEDAQQHLCTPCRESESVFSCERCNRELFSENPVGETSNQREIEDVTYCLRCADEVEA